MINQNGVMEIPKAVPTEAETPSVVDERPEFTKDPAYLSGFYWATLMSVHQVLSNDGYSSKELADKIVCSALGVKYEDPDSK